MKSLLVLLCAWSAPYLLIAQFVPGATAAWSFDQGDATDEVGDHDGEVFGAELTTDRFGNPDLAYAFDGTENYINVAYDPIFSPGDSSFTISLWFNTENDMVKTGQTLLNWYRCGSVPQCSSVDNALYSLGLVDGVVNFWLRTWPMGESLLVSSVPLNDGAWHHVVGILDRDLEEVRLYVDNVLVDAVDQVFDAILDDGVNIPLSMGRTFRTGWGSPGEYYDGALDDVAIYHRALSDAEVALLFGAEDPHVGMAPIGAEVQATVRYDAQAEQAMLTLSDPGAFQRLVVHDALGAQVMAQRVAGEQTILRTGALPAGMYFISLYGMDGQVYGLKFYKP